MICLICGHENFWSIPFVRDPDAEIWRAELGDHNPHTWHLCRRCGNAVPSKQPDLRILRRLWEINRSVGDLDPAAIEAVWKHRQVISRAGAERSYHLFAPLARNTPGRFLDIACGLGETVQVFAAHGWDAEGIDTDPSTARFHRELGIRSRIGQIEAIDVGPNYDIIHIAHAIYFVTEPMRFLKSVREWLAPNGLFCVVLADFLASYDPSVPSYAHSFFPSASSMQYALTMAGFETIYCKLLSGSVFIAARASQNPKTPPVYPIFSYVKFRTKRWRYACIGRPYLALRKMAKAVLRRSQPQ